MTKKEAIEGMLSRLKDPLGKRGFSLLKTRAIFVGTEDELQPIFSFQVVVIEQSGVEFRPHVSIRAEAVEAIRQQVEQTAPLAAKNSITLGNELGRITGNVHRWRVEARSQEELDSAATGMVQTMDDGAMPFYKQYDNLKAIDEHVNTHPDKPAILCPLHVQRAEIGVIVGRLVGRADLDGLVKAHRAFLETISKHDVKEFEEFLVRLNGATT
jgi:hypothetical protein